MNTHTPRAQQHRQVQSLAVLAMFTAILFLLTFTPIGMIDLPIIKATVLHVPVIIGALLLGPKKGAFLGGMFGLASLLKNTLVPNLSSFAFSPLIPVPGLDRAALGPGGLFCAPYPCRRDPLAGLYAASGPVPPPGLRPPSRQHGPCPPWWAPLPTPPW